MNLNSNKQAPKLEKIEMKVYRLNENDFVAAQTLDEVKRWYCEETGLFENDAIDEKYFVEVDINKYSMWLPVDEIPKDKRTLVEEFVKIDGEDNGKLLFKHVIDIKGRTDPYLIDSIGQ